MHFMSRKLCKILHTFKNCNLGGLLGHYLHDKLDLVSSYNQACFNLKHSQR
jgi:hypothetical protein